MKPSIPKGTRDFSPIEMVKRNYIFDTIRDVFKLYGFLPIETPSMENSTTLMGKYGEEGDKLIFKILNSGDFLKDVTIRKETLKDAEEWKKLIVGNEVPLSQIINSNAIAKNISEKALRYDLTVPFARYVVMHQNEITFPFKRYQIQPVWRADRPQKGRYREFYQCDADVIGSNSLLNEVELIMLIDEVFERLGLKITVKVNNRKILSGIAEIIGEVDKIIDITVAIDKLDKIGVDKVKEELLSKGLSEKAINQIEPLLLFQGTDQQKLDLLKNMLANSVIGLKGIEEVEAIFEYASTLAMTHTKLEVDITLARGLNYYTGAIFEVIVNDERSTFTSSICGGGRYDDLTGIFGLPNMSGVGISFGADRIYDVLEEANLFPKDTESTTQLLIVDYANDVPLALSILKQVRDANITAELYPDESKKFAKQMDYAEARKIPFVVILSKSNSNEVELKDIHSGEKKLFSITDLINKIK